jgi:hypothetical protein
MAEDIRRGPVPVEAIAMASVLCRWQLETEVEWVGVAAHCGRVSTSSVPGSYAATGARKEARTLAVIDPQFEAAVAAFEQTRRKYRNALRVLAK